MFELCCDLRNSREIIHVRGLVFPFSFKISDASGQLAGYGFDLVAGWMFMTCFKYRVCVVLIFECGLVFFGLRVFLALLWASFVRIVSYVFSFINKR